MKLVPLIVGCATLIAGMLLFFGAWWARLELIIETTLLILLNLFGFIIMLVSFFIILIALFYPDEDKHRRYIT